jgi:phage tail P2-like protein
MKIEEIDLLSLQTKVMQGDPDVQGFAAALELQFKQLAGEIGNVLIYSNIDQLPAELLDILAWQFIADWYDATSDLVTKRKAIKDALLLAQIKGTPAAVQKVIDIYFGDGQVQEWFEYGGTGVPGTFRVITSNSAVTNEKSTQFIRMLNKVKRLSAKLDSIQITEQINQDLYFAGILHMGEYMTIGYKD